MRVALVGHSLGAEVLLTALTPHLMRDFLDTPEGGRVTTTIADIILLLNPAVEGSRYQTLHDLALSRAYPTEQQPILISFTSEVDSATGVVFPLGRALSYIGSRSRSREQRRWRLLALGHDRLLITHRLAPCWKWVTLPEVGSGEEPEPTCAKMEMSAGMPSADCACPHIRGDAPVDSRAWIWLTPSGVKREQWSLPFRVVGVDEDDTPDHNDYFTPLFVDYLARLILGEDWRYPQW